MVNYERERFIFTCMYWTLNEFMRGMNVHNTKLCCWGLSPLKNLFTWWTQQKTQQMYTFANVLQGPRMAWKWSTPCWLMAVHIVTFPPRWPGTFTIARWPIMFLPLLLLLVKLNPASSIKIISWGTGRLSISAKHMKRSRVKYYPETQFKRAQMADHHMYLVLQYKLLYWYTVTVHNT